MQGCRSGGARNVQRCICAEQVQRSRGGDMEGVLSLSMCWGLVEVIVQVQRCRGGAGAGAGADDNKNFKLHLMGL